MPASSQGPRVEHRDVPAGPQRDGHVARHGVELLARRQPPLAQLAVEEQVGLPDDPARLGRGPSPLAQHLPARRPRSALRRAAVDGAERGAAGDLGVRVHVDEARAAPAGRRRRAPRSRGRARPPPRRARSEALDALAADRDGSCRPRSSCPAIVIDAPRHETRSGGGGGPRATAAGAGVDDRDDLGADQLVARGRCPRGRCRRRASAPRRRPWPPAAAGARRSRPASRSSPRASRCAGSPGRSACCRRRSMRPVEVP